MSTARRATDSITPSARGVRSFDLIARPYRWMEYLTFGRALHRCRLRYLSRLEHARRALILGDGDGRFTAALLAANPHVGVDAVDISPAMLRLLHQRAAGTASDASARLRTHHTDALTFIRALPLGTTYDLVVSHFFLDCLTQPELAALSQSLAQHLAWDALWLVSDFRIPAGPMRLLARPLVGSLYVAFRMLAGLRTNRLPDHPSALSGAGLTLTHRHLSLAGLLTSELWTRTYAAQPAYTPSMLLPPQRHSAEQVPDPVPDPEPASPSLPTPDPGVFHPDIPAPLPPKKAPTKS